MGTIDELDAGKKAEIGMMLVVYLAGVVGNLLVIFVIFYLGEYKKITHWYVLQLALADLIFLQAVPFKISEITHKAWILPLWLCKAKQAVLYINYYGSIIFLTLMALDRYLAVCHGLSNLSRRIRSRRPCYIITAIAWIVAILMCIPVMMYADTVGDDPYCVCSIVFPRNKHQWCEGYYNGDEYDVEKCITETYEEHIGNENCEIEDDEDNSSGSGGGFSDYLSDYTDAVDTKPCKHHEEYMGHEAFILFNFIVMFIIPLITISVCYTLIIVRLRRTDARSRRNSERNESSHSSETTRASTFIAKSRRRKSSSGGGKKQKTKVTIMCVVLVLLFATCWMPYNVVQTVKLKGIENVTEAYCSGLDTITIIFLYLNSALNPYLYNFLGTFGKRIGQIRKHRRTKTLMSTFKLNRVGRKSNSFVSSSETAKTKKSSIPNEKFRVEYLPKEEEPLTIENVYEDKPTSSGTQL